MNTMPEPLLSVAEALDRVLAAAQPPLGGEIVPLAKAFRRTLARPLVARRTQPPFAASAMDGYAVRSKDLTNAPVRLRPIGMSAAGHGFRAAVGPGEAVRIFTGAPLPEGADTILLQENARVDGDAVVALQSEPVGRHVRPAGLDFREGQVGLAAGQRLDASALALAAAMNHAEVTVARQPRVAILATGDELVRPGTEPGADQIVASNSFALAAIVEAAGGLPIDIGIAGDSFAALEASIKAARDQAADVLVTLGGASVGDHDLVQSALARAGMELGFWRVAMRPGKPLMHGRLGDLRILGLPGNPVSSIVCGFLFVRPLVRALCGDAAAGADCSEPAVLAGDLPANDRRQDYLRATLMASPDGPPRVTVARQQDSSMLRVMAEAQCLVVRAPHVAAARAGDACRIIRLDRLFG